MKFGVCCSVGQAAAAKKIGFDYWELNLRELAQMDEEAFKAYLEQVQACGLPAEAANCFFQAQIRITGEGADLNKIADYARLALSRAAAAGVKIVVFGSGDARKIEEGFDPARAYAQFVEALRVVGKIAGEYGVMIAVEPLRKAEDNLINTVPQGLQAAREAANPNVAGLADLYHMKSEQESFSEIGTYGQELIHIHIASADRRYPHSEDGQGSEYAQFAEALRACRYQGRISIEAGTSDFEKDAARSLSLLQSFAF